MSELNTTPALHYAEPHADATPCGISLDGLTQAYTAEPNGPIDCLPCLVAARGGLTPDYSETPEYGQGYAHGKDKAHFEVRHLAGDNHAKDCGCEPCITARAVLSGAAYDVARWAAIQTLGDAVTPFAARAELAAELAVDCAASAGADLGKAAGLGVAAARRMLENLRAQADGTADALGLDPTGRLRSWAGRYDGAE